MPVTGVGMANPSTKLGGNSAGVIISARCSGASRPNRPAPMFSTAPGALAAGKGAGAICAALVAALTG